MCLIYPNFVNQEFDTIFTVSLILIIGISTFSEYFFGMTYKLYLQADQKTYVTSTIQIGTTILNTIVMLILINLGASIQWVKLIGALIYIIRPILQNIYVKKKYNINLKNVKDNYEIKQRWDGLAQHIAGVIHGNTDVTLLTIFSNVKEVSVYSVYYQVIAGVRNITQIFSTAIEAGFGDMIARGEKENLNKKFNMYEFIYFTIVTIVYSCTGALIVPFIKVYTNGVTDIEYVRYLFAYIIVVAYFVFSIKIPYNSLVNSAGNFVETRRGAWIEAISNLIISIILVFKFGIVGVAIGTLISVLIRAIELIIFSNKYILNRKARITLNKILLSLIQLLVVIIISHFAFDLGDISYISWILMAIKVLTLSIIIVVPVNIIINKNDFKEFLNLLKGVAKWKRR